MTEEMREMQQQPATMATKGETRATGDWYLDWVYYFILLKLFLRHHVHLATTRVDFSKKLNCRWWMQIRILSRLHSLEFS